MGRVLINQQLALAGYPPIYDGFTELFALLLIESLHKRITLLSSSRVIKLSEWAKQNGVTGNIAANKAARQTIPAFRVGGVWIIRHNFEQESS